MVIARLLRQRPQTARSLPRQADRPACRTTSGAYLAADVEPSGECTTAHVLCALMLVTHDKKYYLRTPEQGFVRDIMAQATTEGVDK